jgi:hypothetical protein
MEMLSSSEKCFEFLDSTDAKTPESANSRGAGSAELRREFRPEREMRHFRDKGVRRQIDRLSPNFRLSRDPGAVLVL